MTPDQVSAAVRRCGWDRHADRLCCRSIVLALVRASIAIVIVSLNVPIDDRLADRIDDDRLDIRSGYARDRPGFGFSVLQEGLRDYLYRTPFLLAWLGLMGLPRSSKISPMSKEGDRERRIFRRTTRSASFA